MVTSEVFMYAMAGGIFPAFLWLWFWLREDRDHPEPKFVVALTFLAGMAAVVIVLPFQKFFNSLLPAEVVGLPLLLLIWAALEEIFKFIAAYASGLTRKADDEPIDAVIYMISAALGFAALENALFLLEPLSQGQIVDSIVTGNLRFIGATLLHVLASGTVGVFMAFAFSKSGRAKAARIVLGLILAIALHTIFNLSIIDPSESNAIYTFSALWFLVIGLLAFLEKLKRLDTTLPNKPLNL